MRFARAVLRIVVATTPLAAPNVLYTFDGDSAADRFRW